MNEVWKVGFQKEGAGNMISIDKARDLLAAREDIVFGLLFGSLAKGCAQPLSDVDIGVYVSDPLSLLEVGRLTAALERALGRHVDLLVLNTALERKPALAYKAIAEGTLLFCKDPKAFTDFKNKVILRYLDTAVLRAMISQGFRRRLAAGLFGEGG
jgi:predicted nucleotidyltransferase